MVRAPSSKKSRRKNPSVDVGSSRPWVLLALKGFQLPALLDSGSSISFIRRSVFDGIQKLGLRCQVEEVNQVCCMAAGQGCVAKEVVTLSIKLQKYSWTFKFFIFDESPVPCILGMDFLVFAKVQLDFAASSYSFAFDKENQYKFESLALSKGDSLVFPCTIEEVKRGSLNSNSCRIDQLVEEFPELFSEKLGTVKGVLCDIDLTDLVPVRSRPYQCSPPRLKALREIVQELLQKGVVRTSFSQYASPAFLVPKSHGKYRMVVDYRLLNKKVVFDAFPMPSVEHAFSHFHGAKVFSVLDLNSAYYQIPLSARSRKLTAFCTPFGLFEFNKLPMGISVGCQVLSRVVDSLFSDLKYQYIYNFMDDLVVYSATMEEHVEHLKEVFRRLQKAGFTLNREKLHLAQPEIKFLGHLVSGKGIEILPERVEAISSFPRPKNLKAVRRFLGMVGFYGAFVKNFSRIAEPLHALKRKNATFVWGELQQLAFEELKRRISTPPVLQVPDFSKEFVLVCDASEVAISAVLNQRSEKGLAPVAFASRLLSPAERKYDIHEKECLAVVWGCERFRVYLEHKEFTLYTDNQALSWLLKHVKELGRLGRWILRLAHFKFKVVHISGNSNVVADCLTRQFEDLPSDRQFSGLVLQYLPAAFQSIHEHQKKDPYCRKLYEEVQRQDPAARNFSLKNGTLIYFPPRARVKRYVVPLALRPMILEYFHDSVLSAHLGVTKTLQKISKVFYWPGLRQDVCKYVRQCTPCQQAKPAQNAQVGLHRSEVVSKPMERLFIDFMGPIVRSRRGNVAILVILDGFSKFIVMYPVRRITSEVVVKCLVEKYFPCYGVPQSIVSDNATVFKSRLFYNTMFSWGIKHITISPYYPQASQVERFNRNLKAALTIYHHSQHTRWDENLTTLGLAFNSAWHESTGTSPALLFLGREINHPLGLKWELADLELNRLSSGNADFWEQALKRLKNARDRVADRYNALRKDADFRVGDLVLVKLHPQSDKALQRSAKLDNKGDDTRSGFRRLGCRVGRSQAMTHGAVFADSAAESAAAF